MKAAVMGRAFPLLILGSLLSAGMLQAQQNPAAGAAGEGPVIIDPATGQATGQPAGQTATQAAAAAADDVADPRPARDGLPRVDAEQSRLREGQGLLPEMLAAIAAEREALQDRARSLDMREAELAFASTALAEQTRQLTALRAELMGLLDLAETRHGEDIERLVKIYRAMKPAEAAAILSSADLEVTVLVLAAMVERDAGPILARMNQVRAQAVSKIIMERSRLPADQRLLNLKVN